MKLDDTYLGSLIFGEMTDTMEAFKPMKRPKGKLCSTWRIGLEYEFEQVGSNRPTGTTLKKHGWESVEDGSLRDGGLEFRFSTPTNNKTAEDRIKKLHEWWKKFQWSKSRRTSLHVHLDMRSVTFGQFKRIMATYALLEPALFTFAGTEREECIYCIPYYRADMADVSVLQKMYIALEDQPTTRASAVINKYVHGGNKYSALNYRTLTKFGSLEFRHAQLLDEKEVFKWVNILMKMGHYALDKTSVEQIVEEYAHLGAISFTRKVLGKYYVALKIGNLNKSTGMSLQDFNDTMDVLSIAERVGGVKNIIKSQDEERWAVSGSKVKRRGEPRHKVKRSKMVTPDYMNMMPADPEG